MPRWTRSAVWGLSGCLLPCGVSGTAGLKASGGFSPPGCHSRGPGDLSLTQQELLPATPRPFPALRKSVTEAVESHLGQSRVLCILGLVLRAPEQTHVFSEHELQIFVSHHVSAGSPTLVLARALNCGVIAPFPFVLGQDRLFSA